MPVRVFTVEIVSVVLTVPGTTDTVTVYEASFAGIQFSRDLPADVMKWVRVAARHRYGSQTQVIFVQKGIEP